MMLQRRNHFSPFGEFRQMQANMDRMRRRFGSFHHPGHNGFTGFEPWPAPLDVVADGDDFVVRASMPGAAPENIQVSIEDGVLTVRGETASHFETTEGNYLMRERRSGSFHRSLRLPDTVDQDKAEPRYEHGVLTISLPKAEAKKAKQFEVRVAEGPAAVEGS
ncbi:MAG: Hsp20/alpha crystallin family protein [Chloroflexi bacterium]|nr:Hsp20/alpha crystallin family protein [Chloroflexota bacterium]